MESNVESHKATGQPEDKTDSHEATGQPEDKTDSQVESNEATGPPIQVGNSFYYV